MPVRDLVRYIRGDLRMVNPAERKLPGRVGLHIVRFVAVLVAEYRVHALGVRAASLVYSTILSLVPLLAVAFSLLKAFGAHYVVEPFLTQLLAPIGPQAIDVTHKVIEFVDNLHVRVLGAVGVAGLFFTVISLIENVENAFNHIWRVRQARSYGRMFSDYLSVILVGPVLVFAALGLIASAESHRLVQWLLTLPALGTWGQSLAHRIVPFTILCVAFTFLYRFVPNTRVATVSAAVGGVSGALLWQLAGMAFTSLIVNSARYVSIYSGFAVLFLFLIWLQLAWLVLLLGATIAYLHEHPTAYGPVGGERGHVFREHAGLGALVEVTRRYLTGQPPLTPRDLAQQLHVPLAFLEDILDTFIRRGILLQASYPEGIAFARPPERVSVAEILEVLGDPDHVTLGLVSPPTVANALHRRDEATRQALGELTLRALVPTVPPTDTSVVPHHAVPRKVDLGNASS